MPRTRKVKKLLVKMEELVELQRRAIEDGDRDEVQKYAWKYLRFVTLHQKTLKVSNETIAELRASCEKGVKVRNKIRRLNNKLEKVKQTYYNSLLEIPPIGKKRTEH